MDHRDILIDAARRPLETAELVLTGIPHAVLTALPGRDARWRGSGNSIGWLVWHAARQMDVQLCELTGATTVWEQGGWAERLGIDREPDDMGLDEIPYQDDALQVRSPELLLDHLEACIEAFCEHVLSLDEHDLDDVVDESWDPPVTRGVRLVSIINDATTHLGQASYARGLLEERASAE